MKTKCVVLGAGGHARVLIDCLIAAGESSPSVVLDSNASQWGTTIGEVPVEGGDELLSQMIPRGITHFVVGLGSVGDSGRRRALYDLGLSHGLTPLSVKHPSAVCSPFAKVGPGAQLLPACVVNAGARVDENVIVNTSAVIEHDSTVGAHAHIATGAKLSGGVRVGVGAHVGAGATIKQGMTIGDHAVVGAGAVVVKDVPAGVTVVGVPARPLDRGQSNE
jgi:sugar O-acyltransferase (sialic acid O-acetyltransferase NeuD family)